MQDAMFKISIFGDGGVGKTTLVNKYLTGVFKGDTSMTIGVDFHIKKLELFGLKVALQIWDFAGEDRFRFLLSGYMSGASGGIFMYDITRLMSLKNINDWLNVLNTDALKTPNQIPILLVGGKLDQEEHRSVESNYAMKVAESLNLNGFIECSAKTGDNVEVVFESLTLTMLERAGLIKSSMGLDQVITSD